MYILNSFLELIIKLLINKVVINISLFIKNMLNQKKKKALSLSYSVLTDRLNRNFVMNGNLQVALTFKICVWDEGWHVQDPSSSASE